MIEFSGIITSDWHLVKKVPPARIETEEEWYHKQQACIDQVVDKMLETGLPIYHCGDIYDKSQPYYGIVSLLQKSFSGIDPELFQRIAGNHDLPYNSFVNVTNSGWYNSFGVSMTTEQRGACHFGTSPRSKKAKIIFTHQLSFKDEKSKPPFVEAKTAAELLEEFPNAQWIFVGDNHQRWHYESKGRHVLSPGTFLRHSANEENYDVGFYEVHTHRNEVIFHPIEDNAVMDTTYLKVGKERDERIDAFLEVIESKSKVSLSFIENLNKKLMNKKISKPVKDMVQEIKTELEGVV